MNLLPAVKCICPSCFEEIYLGECRIMSGRTAGKVLKTPSKGALARMRAESLVGPKYTLELARRECTECGYLLPPNIELVPSIILVVVGDVFSGKSHYIAAMIHQIKADWIGHATGYARFNCLTPEVEKEYMKEYFEPLFVKQTVVRQTVPQPKPLPNSNTKVTVKPLIYKLVVSPSPRHPPTTVNLMIYDTSGEDFENMDRLVHFARFFLNTSGFVFVADPITMNPITVQLDAALQTALQPQIQYAQAQGRKAADGLNAVIDIYESYHKVSGGSSLPNTPISIMLSKADLLKYSNPRTHYHFLMNPQYGNGIDLQDINIVDQEVKRLFNTYGQGDLLAATTRFKKVKFFATSATGEPPDGGTFMNVEPLRCLDPLLWILHQLDVVRRV